MTTYDFEMAQDESHAIVRLNGVELGIIQNTPEYLGGGLNFTGSGDIDEKMWDHFYDWTETL